MADFDSFDFLGPRSALGLGELPDTFDLIGNRAALGLGDTPDSFDFLGPRSTLGLQNAPSSFLDQVISGGKNLLSDITPDAIKALLSKGVDFAKNNPFTAGGLGGAALMALLSSMNKGGQQQAPQYIGLGASGPAPAAAPTQFVQLPSQAQSYKSMMGMKDGGVVHMNSGDYVFSKKAMDNVGGIEGLRKRGYPAKPIKGPGTGTSDSIPATIDGQPVARVANGEALIPGGAKMKGLAGLHARMRKGK